MNGRQYNCASFSIENKNIMVQKYICGTIYINNQHYQFSTKRPIGFCPICQHHELWTKRLQLYCMLVPQVPYYWWSTNKYPKYQMHSPSDNISCIESVNKHIQSHGPIPFIRGIGRSWLDFIMVELYPIGFNKPLIPETIILWVKGDSWYQMNIHISKNMS